MDSATSTMQDSSLKPGLRIEQLSHAYGHDLVLKRIQCAFPDGTLVAVLGPSGCGKTTLLKICAGLIPAQSGSVRINGENPLSARSSGVVGFAFQSPTLLPWRTALQNILLPLELLGVAATPEKREYARELLVLVGLKDKGAAFPRELSGGMQQRVGLARALVTSPSALFLDEPFGALDGKTRNALNEKVRQIWQRYSLNTLFVTHSIEEAVFVADQVIILSQQPASIAKILPINLGTQRTFETRYDPRYSELVHEIDRLMEDGQ